MQKESSILLTSSSKIKRISFGDSFSVEFFVEEGEYINQYSKKIRTEDSF